MSSAQLRDKDQKILEKHAREKAELELRIHKLKNVSDERAKELFDALHRGNRLARSIGFDDLYRAQIYLDSFDHAITFKESMDRMRILEAELNCEKKEVEILQVRLSKLPDSNKLQDELVNLKTELRNSTRRHQEELKQLQDRYDSLRAVKQRADERYKADYKKWRAFSKWIFAENDKHQKHRNEPGISNEEKKRRDLENIMRKRQKMIEIGPNLAQFEGEPDDAEALKGSCHPPTIGCTEPDANKENDATGSSPSQKQSTSARPVNYTSPSRPLQPMHLNEVSPNNVISLPSSPGLFFTTGPPATSLTRLSFQPLVDPVQVKQDPDMSPTNVRSLVKRVHMPGSSDTEEDSQAVAVPSTNPRSGMLAVFKVPAPPVGSSSRSSGPKSSQIECAERPSKIRRLSDDSNALSWVQDDLATPCASKGRKKHKVAATPLGSGEDIRRPDYSAYKGRGRYSGQIQNPEKTINALYAIDPKSNGGKNYQYDEIIRNKDERRKMHAGDCECCRDYYKNIGPLPSRLQQPLWRSPSKTPSRSHTLEDSRRGNSDPVRRQADIDAHRQVISRHRQTWARAKTPPGYWEIGFPNTQEVGDINKKAEEMQRKKMIDLEKESNRRGGRYRRK